MTNIKIQNISMQYSQKGGLPLVSICCTAFNHEKFIRNCLDGFLIQKTNFKVEILINDDCSTDSTASIIKEYELKYPTLFNVFYQKENQYSKGIKPWPNVLFPASQGKYIALCEGDDYWTDPLKLQKQVDFLEANLGYIICGHHRYIYYNDRNILVKNKQKQIKTQCAVFRSDPIKSEVFLKYASQAFNGDTFLFSYLNEIGKFKILNFYSAVYRVSESGVYSSKSIDFKINMGLQTLKLKERMFLELGWDTNIVDLNLKVFYYYSALNYLQINDLKYKEYFDKFLKLKIDNLSLNHEITFLFKKIKFYILILINKSITLIFRNYFLNT